MSKQKHSNANHATPKPISGLMDKRFVYVPAAATDITKTFERIRAQQQNGRVL